MWSGQTWWHEVRVLISLRISPRRLRRLVFVFRVLLACELSLELCHSYAEQAIAQSSLEEDVSCDYEPSGCGRMPGKVVKLNHSL